MLLMLVGCSDSYKFEYKKGECLYHLNYHDSIGKLYYKVVDKMTIEGNPTYIVKRLNWKYRYDFDVYDTLSASYVDSYHNKFTHEEVCKRWASKESQQNCINKEYPLSTRGVKCPTKEEFLKIEESQ